MRGWRRVVRAVSVQGDGQRLVDRPARGRNCSEAWAVVARDTEVLSKVERAG